MVRNGLLAIFFCMLYMRAYAFSLGIENISPAFLKAFHPNIGLSYRVGLIANQTARDSIGNRTIDCLIAHGFRIVYILAPEHGFDGSIPAGIPIFNQVDVKTGVPIVSIYGAGGDLTTAGKQISDYIMRQIDVLFYDIQDSGMRHYTYISTLLCALEAAAKYKKPLIVFDRPNLLGHIMEGPLVEPGLKSFISLLPIPLRHGMTVGELALYCNACVLEKPAKLKIIKLTNYRRTEKPQFLAPLSPNLVSYEAVLGYSFLGLLGEVEPFEVGVGTPDAFQVIMLPDSIHFPLFEWCIVQKILRNYGINSAHYTFLNRKNKPCSGLKLRFNLPIQKAFILLLELLKFFAQKGIPLKLSNLFDKAIGTSLIRDYLQKKCDIKTIKDTVNAQLTQFYNKVRPHLLYSPYPSVHFYK